MLAYVTLIRYKKVAGLRQGEVTLPTRGIVAA